MAALWPEPAAPGANADLAALLTTISTKLDDVATEATVDDVKTGVEALRVTATLDDIVTAVGT